ncbi:hypothetical protein CEP54_004719 [Fusarium duplospermum]|uniref:F-box domain-containing protein n=1 Tax=Fusarium duplospermum TaxID=1325734 RepID=A0A428QGW6_9HYPO|nr:hypothetical protein CEP54_004719 [Fusarium duplospermum]
MNLTDFSTEILLQICEALCPHCQEKHLEIPRPDWWRRDSSRRALLNLCLVNREVGAMAQRVLYHHFGYVEKDRDPDDLVRFCRTICAKPELGKCLRWANLSSSRVEVNFDMIGGWLTDAFDKFLDKIFLDEEYFERGSPRSAFAALILLQAPNLERLDDDGKNHGSFLRMMVWDDGTSVYDDVLPQNLRSVKLGDWICSLRDHERHGIDLRAGCLGYLLSSLPKLDTLTIYCPAFSAPDDRVRFQHLRVLRLVLEEFAHYYYGLPGIVRTDAATISDICEVLAQRKDTLRRLLLDASCTTDDIDGLRELDNLEELKIGAGPILEPQPGLGRLDPHALVRVLPPSLKKLHVKSKMPGLDLAGEALMTYIESTYRESTAEQKLKQVYFDVYEEPDRAYFPLRRKLEKRCRDWIKNGSVVFSVGRFAWDDMGDWGSGEGNIDAEDNRDI